MTVLVAVGSHRMAFRHFGAGEWPFWPLRAKGGPGAM